MVPLPHGEHLPRLAFLQRVTDRSGVCLEGQNYAFLVEQRSTLNGRSAYDVGAPDKAAFKALC